MESLKCCNSCNLSLPNNYLTPVIFRNNQGQTKIGYLCDNCKAKINAEQKGRTNV